MRVKSPPEAPPRGSAGRAECEGELNAPGVFAGIKVRASAHPRLLRDGAQRGNQTPPLPVGAGAKGSRLPHCPVALGAGDFCREKTRQRSVKSHIFLLKLLGRGREQPKKTTLQGRKRCLTRAVIESTGRISSGTSESADLVGQKLCEKIAAFNRRKQSSILNSRHDKTKGEGGGTTRYSSSPVDSLSTSDY